MSQIFTRFRALLMVCGLMLVACGDSEPPTKGEVISYAQVCDKANEGKRIAVDGYLRAPEQFGRKDISLVLRLGTTPDRKDLAAVSSTVKVDQDRRSPNTMNPLPSNYTDADLQVRTHEGKVVSNLDKVRVHGTLYFPSSIATVEVKCGLSNPLIELAP